MSVDNSGGQFEFGGSRSVGGEEFDFPDDHDYDMFDQLIIGTPINVDRNQIWLGRHAFDLDKLLSSRKLLKIPLIGDQGTTARTRIQIGSAEDTSQDTSGWNTSAEIGLKTGIVDASAMFYVKQTLNACKRASSIEVIGKSVARSYVELWDDLTAEQVYNCTSDKFQALFKAVSTAGEDAEADPSKFPDLVAALANFYDTYGTGFVD